MRGDHRAFHDPRDNMQDDLSVWFYTVMEKILDNQSMIDTLTDKFNSHLNELGYDEVESMHLDHF